MPGLFPLLQQGVIIPVRPGQTVEGFLLNHLGLSPGYIAQNVSTVFLNGKPVDDIQTAVIREDNTLALSGAMPGLVGAVMRRGSYYSSFRDTVTHDSSQSPDERNTRKEILLRIKLFNKILRELGPRLLLIGVIATPLQLLDIAGNIQVCTQIHWNDKIIGAQTLPDLLRVSRDNREEVFLKLLTANHKT